MTLAIVLSLALNVALAVALVRSHRRASAFLRSRDAARTVVKRLLSADDNDPEAGWRATLEQGGELVETVTSDDFPRPFSARKPLRIVR